MTRSETNSERIQKWFEAPKFHYDMSFDLQALQNALKAASFLNDSGYKSINDNENKTNNKTTRKIVEKETNLRMYGTGWMVADNLSIDSRDSRLADEWGLFFCKYSNYKKIFIKVIFQTN